MTAKRWSIYEMLENHKGTSLIRHGMDLIMGEMVLLNGCIIQVAMKLCGEITAIVHQRRNYLCLVDVCITVRIITLITPAVELIRSLESS